MQPLTHVNVPATDAIVFPIEPIKTPEGMMRVTLWRNYSAYDLQNFLYPARKGAIQVEPGLLPVGAIVNGIPTLGMNYPNTTVNLSKRIVTLWPVPDEETENYFSEGTIHEFSMGIYNSNRQSDVLSIQAGTPSAPGPLVDWISPEGILNFSPTSDDRLLFRYLTAPPSPIIYFPIPQFAGNGTDGTLDTSGFVGVFGSVGFTFTADMIGWQILIGSISLGTGVTVPAGIVTIIGFVNSHIVLINSLDYPPFGATFPIAVPDCVWGLVAPPFSIVNQNTSLFGNDGTGSGSNYTDSTSSGGTPFGSLVGWDVTTNPIIILINFVPYLITSGGNDGETITVGSYNGGPSTPPTSPSYWQVIFQTIGYFNTPLYGMMEFQETGSDDYRILIAGQMQSSLQGEDKRWYHNLNGNPLLDEDYSETGNAPLDAEQIWELRFIHAVASGLSQLPITPVTVATDQSGWYMPNMLMGDQSLVAGNLNLPAAPYNVIPMSANTITESTGIAPYVSNGTWAGYIDWCYALTLMMNAALGESKWTITSDDSPIELEGSKVATSWESDAAFLLYNGNDTVSMGQREANNWTNSPTTTPDAYGNYSPLQLDKVISGAQVLASLQPGSVNYKVNFANPGTYFLPQTLWGLQCQVYNFIDNGSTNYGFAIPPTPRSTCWPDYLLSAWDIIVEQSLDNGFIPILSYNDDGTVNLHFKDRTKPTGAYFAGPVPVTAKPEGMIETEQGIQTTALQSYTNNRSTDGWADDLYAMKRGHGGYSIYGNYDIEEIIDDTVNFGDGQDDTINPRAANPYIVPSTAKKPANLNTLMRHSGFTFAWFNGRYLSKTAGSQIQAMGVYDSAAGGRGNRGFYIFGSNPDLANLCAWYPSLVPLIPGTQTGALHAGQIANFAPAVPDLRDFTPVVRSRFSFKDVGGNPITSLCDSHRQCLARLYSLLFVSSSRKYSTEDLTLTQFWAIDPVTGLRTGEPSINNVALYNERMFPDGNRYYVKHRTPNPNTMTTSLDLARLDGNQFIGNGGNFLDGGESGGALSPNSPPSSGGPAPNGGSLTGG